MPRNQQRFMPVIWAGPRITAPYSAAENRYEQ
jgi:hypothetical protein